MLTFADELGMTGWCSQGRHHRCSHRAGGPCDGGIFTCGDWYRCPCSCHKAEPVGQLELFATVGAGVS